MTLADLLLWAESLPLEFRQYSIIHAEGVVRQGELWCTHRHPVVSLNVDEEQSEILFLHKKPQLDV
jgi:hypothetical protein